MKKTFMGLLVMLVALTFATFSYAGGGKVTGYWKSIDDKTNKATAYWNIKLENGKLRGYLVSYPNKKDNDKCSKCEGKYKDKPIEGTAWLFLDKEEDGQWEEGEIIDTGKGKTYTAKVWEENGKLMVRGYIGWAFSTQEWVKASKADAMAGNF